MHDLTVSIVLSIYFCLLYEFSIFVLFLFCSQPVVNLMIYVMLFFFALWLLVHSMNTIDKHFYSIIFPLRDFVITFFSLLHASTDEISFFLLLLLYFTISNCNDCCWYYFEYCAALIDYSLLVFFIL